MQSKSSFEVDATINFARPLMKKIYHSNKGTYVRNLTVRERIDRTGWKNRANLLLFPKNKFLETEEEQQIDQKDNLMRTTSCNYQSPRKQITFERRCIFAEQKLWKLSRCLLLFKQKFLKKLVNCCCRKLIEGTLNQVFVKTMESSTDE